MSQLQLRHAASNLTRDAKAIRTMRFWAAPTVITLALIAVLYWRNLESDNQSEAFLHRRGKRGYRANGCTDCRKPTRRVGQEQVRRPSSFLQRDTIAAGQRRNVQINDATTYLFFTAAECRSKHNPTHLYGSADNHDPSQQAYKHTGI